MVARSIRDICRWFDVTSGYHSRDPYSLPKIDGLKSTSAPVRWRASGSRCTAPTLGSAVVRDEVQQRVIEAVER